MLRNEPTPHLLHVIPSRVQLSDEQIEKDRAERVMLCGRVVKGLKVVTGLPHAFPHAVAKHRICDDCQKAMSKEFPNFLEWGVISYRMRLPWGSPACDHQHGSAKAARVCKVARKRKKAKLAVGTKDAWVFV